MKGCACAAWFRKIPLIIDTAVIYRTILRIWVMLTLCKACFRVAIPTRRGHINRILYARGWGCSSCVIRAAKGGLSRKSRQIISWNNLIRRLVSIANVSTYFLHPAGLAVSPCAPAILLKSTYTTKPWSKSTSRWFAIKLWRMLTILQTTRQHI